MMDKPMNGWYSARQARIAGTNIYKTAEGKEVIVSMVSSLEREGHGSSWTDIVQVGVVVEYVRRESDGEYGDSFSDEY